MEEEIINFIQEYQGKKHHDMLSLHHDLIYRLIDINGTYIHTYESPPTPVEFLRNCVHPNRPAVIKNAISHWPALERWTNDYFREKMGESIVTVASMCVMDVPRHQHD